MIMPEFSLRTDLINRHMIVKFNSACHSGYLNDTIGLENLPVEVEEAFVEEIVV